MPDEVLGQARRLRARPRDLPGVQLFGLRRQQAREPLGERLGDRPAATASADASWASSSRTA